MRTKIRTTWVIILTAWMAWSESTPALASNCQLPEHEMLDLGFSVVMVKAECACGEVRSSGFIWGKSSQVITTLHSLPGTCENMGCKSTGRDKTKKPQFKVWFEPLKDDFEAQVTATLPRADLALLTIDPPDRARALRIRTFPEGCYNESELLSIGYLARTRTLGIRAIKVKSVANQRLKGYVDRKTHNDLRGAGGPDLQLKILPLDGHLAHGLSGAPVIDPASGALRGIIDGGLSGYRGNVPVSWGIPESELDNLFSAKNKCCRSAKNKCCRFLSGRSQHLYSSIHSTGKGVFAEVKVIGNDLPYLASALEAEVDGLLLAWGHTPLDAHDDRGTRLLVSTQVQAQTTSGHRGHVRFEGQRLRSNSIVRLVENGRVKWSGSIKAQGGFDTDLARKIANKLATNSSLAQVMGQHINKESGEARQASGCSHQVFAVAAFENSSQTRQYFDTDRERFNVKRYFQFEEVSRSSTRSKEDRFRDVGRNFVKSLFLRRKMAVVERSQYGLLVEEGEFNPEGDVTDDRAGSGSERACFLALGTIDSLSFNDINGHGYGVQYSIKEYIAEISLRIIHIGTGMIVTQIRESGVVKVESTHSSQETKSDPYYYALKAAFSNLKQRNHTDQIKRATRRFPVNVLQELY